VAKYLVVDDDPSAVRALTRLLEGDGHAVSPFTEGIHAVDALAREPFDAVITDFDMPHVGGAEVVRAARQLAPGACVVVSTGNPEGRRLVEAGACMVHDKPIDYDAIVVAVGACRARGGPGDGGTCHMKTAGEQDPVPLRRR